MMQNSINVRTNEVFKAFEDIYNRLLNHRQFTYGEIRYLIKEFEERRNDKEVEKLSGACKFIKEINNYPADELRHSYLEETSTALDSLIEAGHKLLGIEKEEEANRNLVLQETIENRGKEIEAVSAENMEKFKEVDDYFRVKEEDLKHYYEDLESKWNLSNI